MEVKKVLLGASAIALLLVSTSAAPALALSTDFGIDIYMSAPKVQGSAATSVTAEDFNSQSVGACSTSLTVGTLSGDCSVSAAGTYGGASSNPGDPSPNTSGSGSNYAYTSGATNAMTIDLTTPARYLGLWWSAGSSSNEVELYSDGELVAQMSTDTLMTLLGNASVSSIGGTSYDTSDYFGNPRDTSLASGEPFVYLNLYATGGALFDEVILSGGGFEFDNLVVSDLAQTPLNSEVPIEFIPGDNAPSPTPAPELPKTGADATGIIFLAGILMTLGVVTFARRFVKA